jgi:2-polyprenyl-3-methyl-5-hydroxy-6-metoxy-1,4-benzoquinol methylase
LVTSTDPQKLIDAYFHKQASFWEKIYDGTGVLEIVHQERLRIIIDTAQRFARPGASVLDIGCGAGLASIALARCGYVVHAVDSVLDMVELTCRAAAREDLQSRVKCTRGDINCLAFTDESFELVIAAGVLPWLPSVGPAVKEMRRVLKPAGHLIISTDNRWGLCWLADPLTNPLLRPFKEMARAVARRFGNQTPRVRVQMMSIRECHRLLQANGLKVVEDTTVGFGPFSAFRRELLPTAAGVKLHQRLQALANRSYPVLRSTGAQYIAVAQRTLT